MKRIIWLGSFICCVGVAQSSEYKSLVSILMGNLNISEGRGLAVNTSDDRPLSNVEEEKIAHLKARVSVLEESLASFPSVEETEKFFFKSRVLSMLTDVSSTVGRWPDSEEKKSVTSQLRACSRAVLEDDRSRLNKEMAILYNKILSAQNNLFGQANQSE